MGVPVAETAGALDVDAGWAGERLTWWRRSSPVFVRLSSGARMERRRAAAERFDGVGVERGAIEWLDCGAACSGRRGRDYRPGGACLRLLACGGRRRVGAARASGRLSAETRGRERARGAEGYERQPRAVRVGREPERARDPSGRPSGGGRRWWAASGSRRRVRVMVLGARRRLERAAQDALGRAGAGAAAGGVRRRR